MLALILKTVNRNVRINRNAETLKVRLTVLKVVSENLESSRQERKVSPDLRVSRVVPVPPTIRKARTEPRVLKMTKVGIQW